MTTTKKILLTMPQISEFNMRNKKARRVKEKKTPSNLEVSKHLFSKPQIFLPMSLFLLLFVAAPHFMKMWC